MTLPASEPSLIPANGLLDLPGLWAMFRRRFRLFCATAITVLALVTIITFQQTPRYTAEARVVLNKSETRALDVSAIISGVSPDAAVVDTEVQLIMSQSMAAQVAEKLNLYAVPEFNPYIRERRGLAALFAPAQLDRDEDVNERIIREQTHALVAQAVEAERAGITYAIAIRATSRDPELAAQIANAYADQYILDQLNQKFETYTLVQDSLFDAVENTRKNLRVAEDAVERYKVENGLLSAEGSLLSEQQIADLQAEMIIQDADLAEKQAKLTTVNRRLSLGAGADAISDVLASPVISTLRSKQADLARRRADLETRYGPKHPLMDNLQSEEADIERQIQEEMDRIVSRLQNDVDVARQRVRSLRTSINELREGLSTDNQALVRLRELEREVEVSRRGYEQLLERSQQVRLFENLAEADARVADQATLPRAPSFPNKKLNILLGLVLGSALGGLVIVIAEVFDTGLRTADDVERALNTQMIALVPQLEPAKLTGSIRSPQDYLVEKPLSAYAESYRTLRSALTLQSDDAAKSVIVAVTSAVSGEGKTVSALCLGRIAALSGDRVIVIDCDLRRRALSAMLPWSDEQAPRGLAEVLSGTVPISAAVRKDDRTDLDILPVSEDRSGTGDLFGGGRFAALLDRLREQYDAIILDTAPLTAVADSRMVVDAADRAVFCVRWKSTPVTLAKSARKILGSLKTPLAGTVLTQVDMRAQGGYGYEGSYKYYAQHGKYYFD
ncbi:polysaccharide biosynthesis tyrosine autokinase [Parvularcula sp. LCG005]|uniref:GumC family protein n=1 Tax=Parvularcula sp. LCG005 TaxID=3078805 RepID=UPI002943BB8F|nr:polysaccharide biosynthesis tyrosine autokinase [Parvularcula sp. LCG005]WOI52890.1 polysaccharide biosynthesis tyrosine autokinase [Parvularcula sp. LCG005]